jgi:hypothetical protein
LHRYFSKKQRTKEAGNKTIPDEEMGERSVKRK